MQVKIPRHFIVLFAALLAAPQLMATTVLEMNLAVLTDRADQIFRGTVLEVGETSVQAGGGTLTAIKYTIRVDESYKGSVQMIKGVPVVEVKMLGSLKQYHSGRAPIPGFPRLDVGSDYLLMVAPPGPVGLTTTMGLGQGAFSIFTDPYTREDMALNGFNNASLFKGMGSGLPQSGPVAYATLVEHIQTELGN